MAEHTVRIYFVKNLTCNRFLENLLEVPGDMLVCPDCERFIVPERRVKLNERYPCPFCKDGPYVQVMTEPMLADGRHTNDGYRVCTHCDYAFFWADEKVIKNKEGQVLVPSKDDPSGKMFVDENLAAEPFYECPRCGRETQ